MQSIDTDPFDSIIRRKDEMKILYRLILLMLTLSVGACGNIPELAYNSAKKEAAKSRPAYRKFQELCNAKDRVVVYDSKKVDGYLFADATYGGSCNGDGWGGVFKWGYEYQECSTGTFSNYKSILNGQLFRFYIGEEGEAACVDKNSISKRTIDAYADKLEINQCLAKREVQYPKSIYAKVLEFGYLDLEGNHVLGNSNGKIKEDLISFHGYSIVDIETGEVLAVTSREYNYTPEPGNRVLGGFSCDMKKSIDPMKVIIPI